jgi:hypothetical protein
MAKTQRTEYEETIGLEGIMFCNLDWIIETLELLTSSY